MERLLGASQQSAVAFTRCRRIKCNYFQYAICNMRLHLMQFKLTMQRPLSSSLSALLPCLCCCNCSFESAFGFGFRLCRCQALKLNTFLWLIRSVERGAWETEILLLFLLLLLCKALFCCILLCAGALKLWLFSHPFVTSPLPLRLHNFHRIFAGFYFA